MSTNRQSFTFKLFGLSLFVLEWEQTTDAEPVYTTKTSWRRLRALVARRDKHICRYCHKVVLDGHLDHIIPISKGGTDHIDNLTWSCRPCNLRKGNTLLITTSEQTDESPEVVADCPNPEATLAAQLFMTGKSPSEIVMALHGVGSNQGRNYQTKLAEVLDLIRTGLKEVNHG